MLFLKVGKKNMKLMNKFIYLKEEFCIIHCTLPSMCMHVMCIFVHIPNPKLFLSFTASIALISSAVRKFIPNSRTYNRLIINQNTSECNILLQKVNASMVQLMSRPVV